MTDDQAASLKAIAQQDEPFFLLGVIRVIDQAGVFVQKNGPRFLEGNAVLYQVGLSLAAIPGKLDIAHGIILAISGQLPGAKCAHCRTAWKSCRAARSRLPAINSFYRADSFFLVALWRAIFYRVVFPLRVREQSPR
jgi:hypothetical protein